VYFLIFTVLPIFSASVFLYSIHCQAFSTPPPRRGSNAPFSVRGLLARDWFYFLVFFFVFACNMSCLNQPALGCDAWSRSLGCGCECYPGFWVEEDKCWPRVPSPQCQEISVGLGFSALSVKE
jgi:hypothetical protein